MAKLFLYLTNTRMVAMTTRGGSIVARREFAVSGAGIEEFQRYLAQQAKAPAHLLTDLADEDFRLDTVPHVGPRDRDAIFARRLAQIYRNTPFRHALAQGRETEGRRDDRVLYTAITNPEVLRPWLDVIERLAYPLAGIYSTAVFSAAALKELDLDYPHTLLVTFSPGEALRQTYFRAGEFKFSRLTPIDLDEGQTLGAMVAEETTRTWQYLDSLRHFAGDDRLEVCVLLHPDERAAIEPHLRGFAQIQYRLLDIEEVSTRLGLKTPPLSSTAEEVMVRLFLMRPGRNHFAAPELRRYATLRVARLGLNFFAIGFLAICVFWTGVNLFRLYRGADADEAVSRQVTELIKEQEQITRSLPTLGVGGSTMRDAVTFYSGSIRPFPAITDFMVALSAVLQTHPRVRLNQVVWQASDDPRVTPTISLSPPRNAPPVKVVPKLGDNTSSPSPDDSNNPLFAGGRYEIALVEATVNVSINDFRAALQIVEKLVEDIGRQPGFDASIVESPFDARSSLLIQGRHGDREPDSMDPRFVVRITHDRGNPA